MANTAHWKKTEGAVRREAEKLLRQGVDAVTFSARFFGPDGLLRKFWGTGQDRRAVVESEVYKWLQGLLIDLRRKEADAFEGEVERLSGRLTIAVPKSLHASLKREAEREGVSLSELIRLKLTLLYRESILR